MNISRTVAMLAAILLSTSALAHTQTTGRIAGTVRDQNGAVITCANVVITNQANGEARATTTDSAGHYAFAFLTPGIYRVRVATTLTNGH